MDIQFDKLYLNPYFYYFSDELNIFKKILKLNPIN